MISVSDCKAAIDAALTVLDIDKAETRFSAAQLLLGTAIQESGLQYVRQLGNGPALGYWQMEPVTHDDIWQNYLYYRGELADKVRSILPAEVEPNPELLAQLPEYAAAMARLKYRRAPDAIPTDLEGQAALYKRVYNTPQGKATEAEYLANWHRVIG